MSSLVGRIISIWWCHLRLHSHDRSPVKELVGWEAWDRFPAQPRTQSRPQWPNRLRCRPCQPKPSPGVQKCKDLTILNPVTVKEVVRGTRTCPCSQAPGSSSQDLWGIDHRVFWGVSERVGCRSVSVNFTCCWSKSYSTTMRRDDIPGLYWK